jgi:hypothetical protein
MHTNQMPSLEPPAQSMAPHVPVVPSVSVDCWSCDTPNNPSRMFCVECGSFIAIGSKTKTLPAAEPFSGPPPVPGDVDTMASMPFVAGAVPLGSYSVEAQRRATRRARTMTAVSSVVLASIIGVAAIYVALPLGDGNADLETAAVIAPASIEAVADDPIVAGETTGAVSGLTVEPDVAALEADVEPDQQPEAAQLVEPEPVVEEPLAEEPLAAEPLAEEPTTEELVADEPIIEPPLVVEPADAVEPMVAEPAAPVEPAEPADPVEPAAPAEPEDLTEPVEVAAQEQVVTPAELPARTIREIPATTADGWVCAGELYIEDSTVRDWSLGRVSFRVRDGFERVVLHLERTSGGSAPPASITAEAVPSTKVRTLVPGVFKPSSGKTTIALQLADGFGGNLALRGYRPNGLETIKEFSVYPAGRDGKTVLISTLSDGCMRVRAIAWNDSSSSLRRAEIHVDVKP